MIVTSNSPPVAGGAGSVPLAAVAAPSAGAFALRHAAALSGAASEGKGAEPATPDAAPAGILALEAPVPAPAAMAAGDAAAMSTAVPDTAAPTAPAALVDPGGAGALVQVSADDGNGPLRVVRRRGDGSAPSPSASPMIGEGAAPGTAQPSAAPPDPGTWHSPTAASVPGAPARALHPVATRASAAPAAAGPAAAGTGRTADARAETGATGTFAMGAQQPMGAPPNSPSDPAAILAAAPAGDRLSVEGVAGPGTATSALVDTGTLDAPAPVRAADPRLAEQSRTIAASVEAGLREVVAEEGTTRIRLTPRGLGDIEVELRGDPASGLRVTLRVENAGVLGHVRADREAILATLRDVGVAVSEGALAFEGFEGHERRGHPGSGARDPWLLERADAADDVRATSADAEESASVSRRGDGAGALDILT